MLRIENLTIETTTGRKLINKLSFFLNPTDRLAVIGEEGNGKSTLLKAIFDPNLISGYAKIEGKIYTSGLSIGYLEQRLSPAWNDFFVIDYFLHTTPLAEANYDIFDRFQELEEIFKHLKLDTDYLQDMKISHLSGGEKVKLQLAKLQFFQHDLLLLDEPTNDLDISTLELLERFIIEADCPVIFISHDETLLERTANMILHIEQLKRKTEPRCTLERLGYADYVSTRQSALAHQEQLALKQRAEDRERMRKLNEVYTKVHHDLNAISRQDPHGAQLLKKKMRAVKATERRFERERKDMTEIPETEESIFIKLDAEQSFPEGKVVLDMSIDQLKVADKTLATDLKLKLVGAEKIAIVGDNGVGKTTLLRAIYQEIKHKSGIKPGYFSQNYAETLDYSKTAKEELTIDETVNSQTVLGSLKFTPQEMNSKIADLSDGQKAKILLLKLILSKCNVLLLDEVSRNLSPLSLPVIFEILRSYHGAIISVSHDRKFIDTVCRRTFLLTPVGLKELPAHTFSQNEKIKK